PAEAGAVITEVVEQSPAARGGIQPGDVILSFDGKRLEVGANLRWLSSTAGPGRVVDVGVLRGGEERVLRVKMERLPIQEIPEIPALEQSAQPGTAKAEFSTHFGIEVEGLTRSLAQKLGATGRDGVVVIRVDAQS